MNTQHQHNAISQPTGDLIARIERDLGDLEARPMARISYAYRLQNWIKARYRDLPMQVALEILGRVSGVLALKSQMNGQVYRTDWDALAPWQAEHLRALLRANTPLVDLPRFFGGGVLDYGLLSRRQVTDTGVQFIVDSFANSVEMEIMKHHGLGTGGTAEGAGNTALTTEIAANHYAGSARPIGSTIEGGSANVYRTVGTHTQTTAGDTVTEHGIFSVVTQGAGVMLDRHLFTGVALAVADSFQTTFDLTLSSGG